MDRSSKQPGGTEKGYPSGRDARDGRSGQSLLRQLAEERREGQGRRESDQELRHQDDERLKTTFLEEMNRRDAAVREVASGVVGQRVEAATSAGEAKGESAPAGVCQLLVRQYTCPGAVRVAA